MTFWRVGCKLFTTSELYDTYVVMEMGPVIL